MKKKIKILIAILFLFTSYAGYRSVSSWLFEGNTGKKTETEVQLTEKGRVKGVTSESGTVKAVEDEVQGNSLVFRLPVYFFDLIQSASAKFDSNLEVGNDLAIAGNAVIDQNLTVNGDLTQSLGRITASNLIYSITAGSGISVSGEQDVTITNSDLGSDQKIFGNIKVDTTTISASSNTDTLIFAAGGGTTLSASGKTVTISSQSPDYSLSGWTDGGTTVYNTTLTDNVGIGTSTATAKLHVSGNAYVAGEIDLTDSIRSGGDAGTSGYLLTSSGGGAMTWTDPASLTPTTYWTNTSNVLHPSGALAGVVDLVVGGNSTASAAVRLSSSGLAYFSGNVGIGTSSPEYKLEVVGDTYLNGSLITDRWTTGKTNIAIGTEVFGGGALTSASEENIAFGTQALYSQTSGDNNIALGEVSMYWNTTGSYNLAAGYYALNYNEDGNDNVALGNSAMWQTVSASYNVAIGPYTLNRTNDGWNNVAIGNNALSGPSGYVEENIAIGRNAQTSTSMDGDENISLGSFTLDELTTADGNIAIGDSAGTTLTSGDYNTIVGTYACCANSATGSQNVIVGYAAGVHLTSGSSNVLLGDQAGVLLSTGSNNILIGQQVSAPSGTSSNQLNIGNLIYGTGLGSGVTLGTGNIGIGSTAPGQKLDVVGSARFSAVGSGTYANDLNLTSDGTLTTSASDIRLKKNLNELVDSQVLSKVLQLHTYTFDWTNGGNHDIGMVAQEVAQIFPEITFTNKTDGYMGINYSRLPTLLVSAIQEQQTLITNLQKESKVNKASSSLFTTHVSITDLVWSFLKEVIFTAKTNFMASVSFMKQVVFKDELKVNSNTSGRFIIPQGTKKVRIAFDSQFSEVPTVYLSPQSQVVGGYSISSIDETGFAVSLNENQTTTLTFDWLALLSSRTQNAPVTVLEEFTGATEGSVSGVSTEQTEVLEESQTVLEESEPAATEEADLGHSEMPVSTDSGSVAE